MSDINSVDKNNLKRLSSILKKKGAVTPKKPEAAPEDRNVADLTQLSSPANEKKAPMNDLQKISKWTQGLKEMKSDSDFDDERLKRVKERLKSGFYNNNPEMMKHFLDSLEGDLLN